MNQQESLCGRCVARARTKAGELRSQAWRLAQASLRARERGDTLRGAAYASQAAAAVAEARSCETAPLCASLASRAPLVHGAPGLFVRAAVGLAAAVRLVAPHLLARRRCDGLATRPRFAHAWVPKPPPFIRRRPI